MAKTVQGKKRVFVDALIAGDSLSDAATRAGRSTRTARRWLGDADVAAALSTAQDARIHALTASLMAVAEKAVSVIERLLTDPDVADYVRLGAAKASIDAALRLYELSSLGERVKALEAKLDGK